MSDNYIKELQWNDPKKFTVELNMDADFAENCSWHVDRIDYTCNRNIENSLRKRKVSNWALVATANTLQEAIQKSKEIQDEMCRKSGKKPVGLPI